MTQTTLDDLITARATTMAEHDGDVLNAFYVMAATNQLITDMMAARDRVLANPPAAMRVAGAAHAADTPAPDSDAGALAEAAAVDAELAEETAPTETLAAETLPAESATQSEAAPASDEAA